MTATIDHEATRKALADQAAAYLANPAGWPAAMAGRALRLRAGHPAYSPTNHALIMAQLFARFEGEGLATREAFQATMRAAAEEIAPRHVWQRRGYLPTGNALHIWSKPVPLWIDPSTGKKVTKDTPGAVERRVFRMERTYRAADVANAQGEDARADYTAPALPEGAAREVFERIAAWITAQGWTVERSGRDMREGGYTQHGARLIVVHGGLTEWAAVEALAHEVAHALLHGDNETRPYAGEHRGDMEAEAESVAYGVLVLFGEEERARGAARYSAEWTRDPERVAVAYERACHVFDAVAAVALGAEGVEVARSAKAERAAAKASNKELAASLRAAGLDPKGAAWQRAKAGESVEAIAADLLGNSQQHAA